MENKLRMEMEALPEPETDFKTMESLCCHPRPTRQRRKKVVMLITAVLALMLCGMGWAKASMRYGLWHLIDSRAYSDLEKAAKKFDLVLPQTLDGVPFCDYGIYALSSQDDSWLEAVIHPAYTPRSVTYGWNRVEVETHPDGSLASETYWKETKLELDFGTTQNELWRYYFKFDENGCWTGWNVSESYETLEYRGITIHVGTSISKYDETRQIRWALWIDEEKQVIFSLHEGRFTDPCRVVECAKAIIDLNS